MSSSQSIELVERYAARNYRPLPVVIERGDGVWVWDESGKKYMDLLSCYSALNFGHRHPAILAAVRDQCERVTLVPRSYHNTELGPLCRELAELCGLDRVLPMNSGAEAVETAIKTARAWGYANRGVPQDRAQIIVADQNFHGRTITVVSFSSEPYYREGFGPFTPGFVSVPFGDAAAIERAIGPDTVAVLLEPIQGEGGVVVPPDGYLRACREICDRAGIVLIWDEVQTGFGRTGKDFCWQHEGARPDLMTLGKALGGGVYPASAVVGTEAVLGVLRPGQHGSTFGGNPLAMAIARASLRVLVEEKLAERAAEMGRVMLEGLRSIRHGAIREVRGRGLLLGIEVERDVGGARRVCERLLEVGLVTYETHERVVRLAPPLIVSRADVDWALERIEQGFRGL